MFVRSSAARAVRSCTNITTGVRVLLESNIVARVLLSVAVAAAAAAAESSCARDCLATIYENTEYPPCTYPVDLLHVSRCDSSFIGSLYQVLRCLSWSELGSGAGPSWAPQVQPPTMEIRIKYFQDLIGLTTTTHLPGVRVCLAFTRLYEVGLYSVAVPAGRRADNNKPD